MGVVRAKFGRGDQSRRISFDEVAEEEEEKVEEEERVEEEVMEEEF